MSNELHPWDSFDFYSCEIEPEHLHCTSATEAVVEAVSHWERKVRPTDAITVTAYRRMLLPSREDIADDVMEHTLEWLDEEYGDPEDQYPNTKRVDKTAVRSAALKFADAVRLNYTPHICEVAERWQERVADHVPEQWLDATEEPTNDA